MIQSQTLIQLCVNQNQLFESLDRFHRSIEKIYRQITQRGAHSKPAAEEVSQKIHHRYARFEKEWQRLCCSIEKFQLVRERLKPRLERISEQTQQLSQSISVRWQEIHQEEWSSTLKAFSDKISALRQEIKAIDFKQTLGPVGDVLFVEHYDTLAARARVIQWPRKIWHMLASLLIVSIYLFFPGSLHTKLILFGSFTAYALICDILRFVFPSFNASAVKFFSRFMRKEEVTRLNSMTFYALSTFLVCLFFPKGIAILSILFLGIGDPMASIVGVKWGKYKLWNRFSLEGSLAFFVACFSISLLYPLFSPSFQGSIWLFALCGGLIGMISEWFSFLRLDDNLIIPLVSALLLQGVLFFF